ncbi:poly(A) RNA polymerase gld-2 homolog A-like isoform X1 [Dreissena polymorpha]|uniref:poly(A) RNA polymerase gld-2 homolog A-like isoform X1 n=1 Tax=Dreissena polymorpha TaxID=45954 RepID=UPI002264F752|nr:poly(A) RNA polymerase gld-2 homolog A-like isoform X1 [Dreissena polymorpha]XP_052282289.1 poly(A) RNA polymerase gld-2 homolog A-like isoform X1 [Dreissena polymorpha]
MYHQTSLPGTSYQPYSTSVPSHFVFQEPYVQRQVPQRLIAQQYPTYVSGMPRVHQWNNQPSVNYPTPVVYPQTSGFPSQSNRKSAFISHQRDGPNPLVHTPGKRSHDRISSSTVKITDEPTLKKKRTERLPPSIKNDLNGTITSEIWRYFEQYKQSDENYEHKVDLRNALYAVFKEIFPFCGLYMVGSSMSGFATKTSDMDLCLMVSNQQIDGKREAVEILMAIQTALRRSKFVRKAQVIRARVPILKFEDYLHGIECDLNINNSVGIRNTHLLRYYAAMDWRVRPLILYVKKWARFHDINDASKKTISSYSLCLMLINYLQSGCEPPVVESVQKLYPDLFEYGDDIRNLQMNVKIEFKSKNSESLGDLFLGFLKYYSTEFDFDLDVASVRQGCRLPIHLAKTWTPSTELSMWKCLKVEEPFDRSNTARSCFDEATFARVMRVFGRSFRALSTKRDPIVLFNEPF